MKPVMSSQQNPFKYRHRLRLEPLERRELLAADVLISEFLASNDGMLLDNDRNSSDWIEIFNRGDQAVNLDGWVLTDDADDLDKWRFPETLIEPGEFQIVFASGKNRQDSNGQLHTNFSLSARGEYLALVPPNSVPINEFSQTYPPQLTNISFGQKMSEHKLISPSSRSKLLVPTNDHLGLHWTTPKFDATSWVSGSSAIGFSAEPPLKSQFDTDISTLSKPLRQMPSQARSECREEIWASCT
jgi:hypothetical protein